MAVTATVKGARGGRRHAEGASAAAMADTVQQLAALLQAGAAPAAAWRHLAASGLAPEAAPVSPAIERGANIPVALRAQGAAWAGLAAAWNLAETVGAPLAGALRNYAAAAREGAQTADDVRVALSEPASTARLMSWLPPLGLALGLALGFDPIGALLAGPLGWGCLAFGLALIYTARRWTAKLVRRAQTPPGIPGLYAELLAVALGGGASIDRARALTDAAIAEGEEGAEGATTETAPTNASRDRIDGILTLSASAGVPIADLLRADAERSRREARTSGRVAAARLSSTLLLPLGVCTLPAFMLLGVAPMAIAVMNMQGLTL